MTQTKLEEVINAIKETDTPAPRVYRQGWQDACDEIAKALGDHAIGGGVGLVREVDAAATTKLDIAERLRDWADDERCKRLVEGICEDLEMAADEIERLRAGKNPSPEERDVGLTWNEIADMDRKSTLPRHAEGDIVERLRSKATDCHASDGPLYLEAAAEITRLRMLDMAAKLGARNDAARAMLAALKEFTDWRDCPESLRGMGWDAYVSTLDAKARAAIAQAEAAGIEVQS